MAAASPTRRSPFWWAHVNQLRSERGTRAGRQLWCQQQGGPNYLQRDTDSRFKIKSSGLLITAGIPSSWSPSSAGLQPPAYFQAVA